MHFLSRQTAVHRVLHGAALGALAPLFFAAIVSAQANSAIAQEFKAAGDITSAAMVVIKGSGNAKTVELAEHGQEHQLIGVVSNTSAIELSEGGAGGVQVVTNGLTSTLVSDINGTIKAGDKVTASPIKGVGMRAGASGIVVGTAQTDLEGVQTESRTVTDKTGGKRTVRIGVVPVQVGVAFYSVSDGQSSYLPPFLHVMANNIAGKNVSAMRVLLAALVLLIVIASIAALLYSAVRSSIISIGRNPLSEEAVRKSLFQVLLISLGVLLFAGIAIYLILAL